MLKNKNKALTKTDKGVVSMPRTFHIEADRVGDGISVSVSGVISILDFSEEAAVLKLRRGRMKISGGGLAVAVYENKIVEISGKISGMEFL